MTPIRSPRVLARSLTAAALVLVTACATARSAGAVASDSAASSASTLIVGARVLDGSGAPARDASVRIVGDRIAAVGPLTPRTGERVIDAHGLVLAPGFIDTHSHADRRLFDQRDALAVVSQGVTTVVVGQDGDSPYPLADFFGRLEREPAAINVASYVGHGTLRGLVMGDDFRRAARPDEVARMRALLATEMRSGALGLSSGLEYDPGIYSTTEELVSLARTSAASGGRYISHLRSEDRGFWPALHEIITIGREAHLPVQLSHMKLAMRSLWGEGDSLIRVLDRARASGVDITADAYPYTYWHSTLTVLFPERDFGDRAAAAFALREVASGDGLLMAHFGPDSSYVGKTVDDIARLRHADDTTTLIALVREAEAMRARTHDDVEAVIGTSMAEPDVRTILAWPWTDLCSDGELDGRHPRGFGAFTRLLGHYVRDEHVLTLEDAVRKMTSLAAHNVGIRDRGRIEPGTYADLVLFDPDSVIDRATPEQPLRVSEGVARVWVSGVEVWSNGATTGAHPGRVIRRASR